MIARGWFAIVCLAILAGASRPGWADAELEGPTTCVIWERAKELLPAPVVPKAWRVASDAAPWPVRFKHGSAVVGEKLWIYGGYNNTYLNDVWYTENGSTWTRTIANAAWSPRAILGAASFMDKMWVLGGFDGTTSRNDVYSSSDGVNWTQVTANAPWAGRNAHATVVHNGFIWVLGGLTESGYESDVWYSADGRDWIRATASAAWGKRSGHAVVVFEDQMWVFGGGGATSHRDAWYSQDGIAWVQATATAPWSARSNHAVALYNGRLWLTGGFLALKDVWYSDDAVNWFEGEMPAWNGRDGHSSHAFANKLYVLGGNTTAGYTNQVWTYDTRSGIGCGAGNPGNGPATPYTDVLVLTVAMLAIATRRAPNSAE
jgi:leucine-zipper-like transcriptional regulator 1